MDVVKSMSGKYTLMDRKTEGLDEYAAAMKFPAELTEKIRNEKSMTSNMTVDGDVINVLTKYAAGEEKLSFKLGETFKSSGMGVETENVFLVKDGELRGTHTIGGMVTTSRRFFKDGVLTIISVAPDGKASMKVFMKKC